MNMSNGWMSGFLGHFEGLQVLPLHTSATVRVWAFTFFWDLDCGGKDCLNILLTNYCCDLEKLLNYEKDEKFSTTLRFLSKWMIQ